MDETFDSVNGSTIFNKSGKRLRTSIKLDTDNDPHIPFWLSTIKTMTTFKSLNAKNNPPTFKNFIFTLKNFVVLADLMKSMGFAYMKPRQFQQDSLENFFAKIRQKGGRFTNPTAASFAGIYKTCLVNFLTAKHSKGGNCEDEGSRILCTVKTFLERDCQKMPIYGGNIQFPQHWTTLVNKNMDSIKKFSSIQPSLIGYVGGYIIKKFKKFTNNCDVCKGNLLQSKKLDENLYSVNRFFKYGGTKAFRLMYCRKSLVYNFCYMYKVCRLLIRKDGHIKDLLSSLESFCVSKINFKFNNCKHSNKILRSIVNTFIKIILYKYFKESNDICLGKHLRPLPLNAPNLYKEAKQIYYNKCRYRYF